MHGWALLASVFGVVLLAELPDKTALAALVLATRHKPLPVLLGAATALTVQSGFAVAAGSLLTLLPARPVHLVAGAAFLVSAWFMWRRKEDAPNAIGDRETPGFWKTTWLAFVVVFVAEWGDLTQIATAALAARWRAPFVVFAGSALALWAVATIAVLVGNRAARFLDARKTQRIAAIVFALVGVALIAGVG